MKSAVVKWTGFCCQQGCLEQATHTKPVLAKRYVEGRPTGLYIVEAPVCLKHR